MPIRLSVPCLTSLAIAVVLLAGCNTNPLVVRRTSCPAVAVVKHTGSITRFGPGGGFEAANRILSATISGVNSDCTDKSGARSVVSFDVSAKAATASEVELPYFVAVVKDGSTLLSKQIYTARVALDRTGYRGTSRLSVTVITPAVPLPPKPKPSDFDEFAPPPKQNGYEVLIGFQLSEAEVVYNISH